jgi:hypothetical protein
VEATLAIVEGSTSVSVRHPVETAVSTREAAQEILRNIIFLKIVVSAISDGPAAKTEQHGLRPGRRIFVAVRPSTNRLAAQISGQTGKFGTLPAVPHLSDSPFPIGSHSARHRTATPHRNLLDFNNIRPHSLF